MKLFSKYANYLKRDKEEKGAAPVVGYIEPKKLTPDILLRGFAGVVDNVDEIIIAVRMKDGETAIVSSDGVSIMFLSSTITSLITLCSSALTRAPSPPQKA